MSQEKSPTHPLDEATIKLYSTLQRLGLDEVKELYAAQKWAQLGRNEFGKTLGSIEATKSFFLTAVELWIAEKDVAAEAKREIETESPRG